jgi:excisionase family DNA binding protein
MESGDRPWSTDGSPVSDTDGWNRRKLPTDTETQECVIIETQDARAPPNAQPIVASVKETARMLNMSETATYEAIHAGEIPHIRIGRRILVPLAALYGMVGIK